MMYQPILNANIIPFKESAGFFIGLPFVVFIKKAIYKQATEDFIKKWYSENSLENIEDFWYINDVVVNNILDENKSERYISCYWNKDVLLEFCGEHCTLKSITVCGNYSGKLLENIGIGDNFLEIKEKYGYEFESYGDVYYLIPQINSNNVIGAEIYANNLSKDSNNLSNITIVAIRIYEPA